MKAYPTLTEMGVERPKQIQNYYVTSINYTDVLRIIYDRPKTSFLTSSRVYKFLRTQDKVAGEGNEGGEAVVMKTHPRLLAAVQELDKILEAKATTKSITAEILDEIELLEEDIALRSECLKVLVGKIPDT